MKSVKTLVKLFVAMAFTAAASSPAADKTLIDYFLPTPIHDHLTTNAWGAQAFSRAIRSTASKIKP